MPPPSPRAPGLSQACVASTLLVFALSACDCGASLNAVPGVVVGAVCAADTGARLPQATVRLVHAGGTIEETADATGAFRFDRVPTGASTLVVDPEGEAREHEVLVDSGATVQFTDPACRDEPLVPGTGTISGQICNRHVGDLVSDALITLALPAGETMVTASDDQGRFELAPVPVGEHVLTAQAAGYQRSWLIPVEEGRNYELAVGDDCTPPDGSGGWIGGRLCDPQGGPLTGAVVRATDAAGSGHTDITDVEGGFLIGPAATGPITLNVLRPPDVNLELEGYVYAGQESTVVSDGDCFEETCTGALITATEEDISLFLVVDRSGSMGDAAMGFPGSRWSGVQAAVESLTNNLEDTVEFGLLLYPEQGDDQCGAGEVVTTPTLNNASEIQGALASGAWAPQGGTPTASSLAVANTFLTGRMSDRRLAVVLATDGGPNCNASLPSSSCVCSVADDDYCRQGGSDGALNCLDNAAAVQQVSKLYDELGIPTYVIGIPGSEDFGWVLDDMAEAGHTALSGATAYYDATDVASLEAALEEIGRRVAGCRLELDENLYEASSVQVFLNDTEQPRDPSRQNGFDVVSQHEVELFGQACDQWLMTDVAVRVSTCTLDG
jgi:hypothetical protein